MMCELGERMTLCWHLCVPVKDQKWGEGVKNPAWNMLLVASTAFHRISGGWLCSGSSAWTPQGPQHLHGKSCLWVLLLSL